MPYTPRLSEYSPTYLGPTADYPQGNPWYYSNGNTYYSYGSGLPNCTAYCFGRTAEILGAFTYDLPQYNDAGEWYDWVRARNTFPTGSVPKLGAIACWYDPQGIYAGHVATVEEIGGTGIVTFSQSGWLNRPLPDFTFNFWLSYTDASTDYMEQWAINRGYQLKGFIYVYDEPTPPPPTPTRSKLPIWMMLRYGF